MSSAPTTAAGGGALDSSAPAAEVTATGQRRFVGGFLAAFFAVLAVVLAFNIVVDPLALAGTNVVPTAVEPDRSIKLDLLQHLKRGPQMLILGDSRGRQAEPSELKRLTGYTAFNAAVTGGSAPEAYVMVRFAADRFPHQKRRYIWFTDNGLASGLVQPQLAQDPRARRYLRNAPRFGLGDVKTYLSTDATKASWRVFELGSAAQLHTLLPLKFALLIAALLAFVNLAPNTWQIRLKPRAWQGMAAGISAAIAVMTIAQPHPFIYFQF